MSKIKVDAQKVINDINQQTFFLLVSSHTGNTNQADAITHEIKDYISGLPQGRLMREAVCEVTNIALSYAKDGNMFVCHACQEILSAFKGNAHMLGQSYNGQQGDLAALCLDNIAYVMKGQAMHKNSVSTKQKITLK